MTRLVFIVLSLVLSGLIVFSAGGVVWGGSSDPTMRSIFLGGQTEGLNQLLADKKILNEAIANAEKLKSKIVTLEQAQKSIKQEDLDKLNKFIPDHIDNINLIIDINNIATRHGMIIKNVKVRSGLEEAGALPAEGSTESVAASGQNVIAETFLSFSVSGDYQSLLSFLDSLASSLRVADVTSLSFSVDDKGINQYNFEIKTYWVK
jgi:Tfp pilus assembly protein PilO